MATIDFNKPDASTSAADVLEDIRDDAKALAEWLDPALHTLTNAPTNAKTMTAVSIASFGTLNVLENQGTVAIATSGGGSGLFVYGDGTSKWATFVLGAQRDISTDTTGSALAWNPTTGVLGDVLGNQALIIRNRDYADDSQNKVRLEGSQIDFYLGANKGASSYTGYMDATGLAMPSGNASTPSFRFSNDADNGMYSYGVNQIGFSCGGAISTILTGNGALIPGGAEATPSLARSTDTDTGMWWPAANKLAWSLGASEAMRLDGTGLGIGTTSPAAILDVYKTGGTGNVDLRADGFINLRLMSDEDNNSTSSDPVISFHTNGDFATTKGSVTWDEATNTVRMNSGVATNTHICVNSSGNVGIGTASPSTVLDLEAAISTVYANVSPSIGNCLIAVGNIQASETAGDQAQILFNINGGTHNRVGSIGMVAESAVSRASALVFCVDNGASRPERLRIDSAGNVGIGTASPGAELDVDGRAKVKSYTVATVPTVVAGGIIYVSDETGGAVLAFSDGTNWRRVTDRAVVS